MAESMSKSDTSLSMRLAVKSIKTKFPKVKNISTQVLHSWILEADTTEDEVCGDSTATDLESVTSQCELKGKLIILDSRPEEEYNVSHIQNAHRVDPDAHRRDVIRTIALLQENASKHAEQTVVCYCSVGYRSSQYVDHLRRLLDDEHADLGNSIQLLNLEGSLFKWANERKDLVDHKNRKTKYAHPFNFLFGKLLSKELRKNRPDT